jgi:hypothetical protein
VVARGEVTRLHVEGATMELRSTSDGSARRRELTDPERSDLLAAARAAEKNDEGRRTCGVPDEVYVSLTIDEHTTSTAICPAPTRRRDDYFAPWRALVEVAARLAAAQER